MTWKDCKQTAASSARYRCDTCRHFKEPINSNSCKDCELNKYKPMLLKMFGEQTMHSDNEMVNLRSVIETLLYMVDDDSDGVEEVMQLPTIKTKQVKYYDEDEQVWKVGSVIVDE